METKIIGFVGRDCYDIVFYLARTAFQLGCSCLIEDYSGTGMCNYVSSMQIPVNEAVDNRGVDICNGQCMAGYAGYGYVFRYFGQVVGIPLKCEEVYFVTDGQLHEVGILQEVQTEGSFNVLLVRSRNRLHARLGSVKMALARFGFGENVMELDFNEEDEAARLSIQYENTPKIKRISSSAVDLIVKFFEIDYDKKLIRSAIKELLRGR
jgi:hypothetical protein